MSLEAKIAELTAAVVALTTTISRIEATGGVIPSEPVSAPTPAPAPAPVAAPAPAAPAMPAPPVFEAPAPAAPAAVPFSDNAGLLSYVMTTYKALGPKGAEIQAILQGYGYTNVNDVKPEQYADFYAKVEALRS